MIRVTTTRISKENRARLDLCETLLEMKPEQIRKAMIEVENSGITDKAVKELLRQALQIQIRHNN